MASNKPNSYEFIDPDESGQLWNPLDFIPNLDETKGLPDEAEIASYRENTQTLLQGMGVKPNTSNKEVVGFEVGDDRLDISSNPEGLALGIVAQEEVWKMKTSHHDTFISCKLWNFCETTSYIPTDSRTSFDYCRRTGEFKHLEFCDYPPLRLIVDAQKGIMDHSSTNVGKSSMLGNRSKSVNPKNSFTMNLANWIQDSTLNTAMSEEPKYIPRMMGGSGALPLWGCPGNAFLYLCSYRHGTYRRVYGTAINEAKGAISDYETRGHPPTAILCSRLRDKQDYLFGTYAGSVMLPGSKMEPEDLPAPLYRVQPGANLLCSFEQRLVSAKKIIPRPQALLEYKKLRRLEDVLLGTVTAPRAIWLEKERSSESRKEYDGALSANAAFQRLLTRQASGHEVKQLQKDGFFNCPYGVADLERYLVEWLYTRTGNVLSLDDIHLPEEMFLREEVVDATSLKIKGIPLLPLLTKSKLAYKETESRVGLWKVSQSMEQWAESTAQRLKQARDFYGPLAYHHLVHIYNTDREWVNDDTGLIAQVIEDTKEKGILVVYMVTNDKRLCRQVAEQANVFVRRVVPKAAVKAGYLREGSEMSLANLRLVMHPSQDVLPAHEHPVVYVDTGSLASTKVKIVEKGKSDLTWFTPNLRSIDNIDDPRFSVFRLRRLSDGARIPRMETYTPRGTDRRPVGLYADRAGEEIPPKGTS